AEDDGPSSGEQRAVHFFVDLGHLVGRIDSGGAAPVVLQVVDAPLGIGPRVLFLVAVGSLIARAGLGSRRGVDADFQAFSVEVAGVLHAVRGDGVCGAADVGGGYFAFEVIPTVPAHRGSGGDLGLGGGR